MSAPGENEKSSATVAMVDRLDWQAELDSALSDIDQRLRHPRRRANDSVAQPTLPQLGQVDLTSELLDEIAWRVSEQIRRSQAAAPAAAQAAPPSETWTPSDDWPEPAPEPVTERSNAAIVIRLRRPLFRWRFWRRRRQVTSIPGYRLT